MGRLDRCTVSVPLPGPPLNPLLFFCPPADLCGDLVADLAFLLDAIRLHYVFHTACFSGTVFSAAMLPEMAPLPIATGETVLIEEAHF